MWRGQFFDRGGPMGEPFDDGTSGRIAEGRK